MATLIQITRGDSLDTAQPSNSFTYTDANGVAINLSPYTAYMTIRDFHGNQITQLTSVNGGLSMNNALGVITPIISASTSATFPVGINSFDLYVSSSSHSQTIVPSGLFAVNPSVNFYA